MSDKEILKKIIERKGQCTFLSCFDCPLCIDDKNNGGFCGCPSNALSFKKAKEMLKKIEIDEAVDKMLEV